MLWEKVYFKSIHPRHAGGCHVEFYSVVTQERFFLVIPDIRYNKWDAPKRLYPAHEPLLKTNDTFAVQGYVSIVGALQL